MTDSGMTGFSHDQFGAIDHKNDGVHIANCFIGGVVKAFAKSGFRRDPLQHWNEQWRLLLAP